MTATRRWISYLPSSDVSIGMGATESEAVAAGRALLPSLADDLNPGDVYAVCLDLYDYEEDVPEGAEVYARGSAYLDGEHEVGVLARG